MAVNRDAEDYCVSHNMPLDGGARCGFCATETPPFCPVPPPTLGGRHYDWRPHREAHLPEHRPTWNDAIKMAAHVVKDRLPDEHRPAVRDALKRAVAAIERLKITTGLG